MTFSKHTRVVHVKRSHSGLAHEPSVEVCVYRQSVVDFDVNQGAKKCEIKRVLSLHVTAHYILVFHELADIHIFFCIFAWSYVLLRNPFEPADTCCRMCMRIVLYRMRDIVFGWPALFARRSPRIWRIKKALNAI